MNRQELHNIFKLAIAKEERAYETYSELADTFSDDPELKSLFEELARDEQEHKKRLEQRFAFMAAQKFGKFTGEKE